MHTIQLPLPVSRGHTLSRSSTITHIRCDTNEGRVATEQLAQRLCGELGNETFRRVLQESDFTAVTQKPSLGHQEEPSRRMTIYESVTTYFLKCCQHNSFEISL